MLSSLRALITASTLPLLDYVSTIQGKDFGKLLFIKNCSEIQRVIKVYHSYIKFLEGKGNKIIVTPLISITPYVAVLNFSQILPSTIFVFAKRVGYSNPFNFKLFLEDVEICMENLKKVFKRTSLDELKHDIMFIYGPIAFNEVMMLYIPIIIVINLDRFLKIFQNREISVFNIEFKNFTVLRRDDEYGILVLDRETGTIHNTNNSSINSDTGSFIKDYREYRVCNPLLCLSNIETINNVYRFHNLEDFISYLLEMGRGNHLYIEFWSSYAVFREKKSREYYYLWMPYIDRDSVKRLVKIIANSSLPISLNKISIISPLNLFSETGSISNSRVWISIIVEQILYKSSITKINLIT